MTKSRLDSARSRISQAADDALANPDDGSITIGRVNPDGDALIQLAKEAKQTGGVSQEDGNVLAGGADERGVPGHGPAILVGQLGDS